MGEKTIEAIVASPPERDDLVVQLFVRDGGQWGEVYPEGDQYLLELYQRNGTEVKGLQVQGLTEDVFRRAIESLGWNLNVDEALMVVNLAANELGSRRA